MRGFNINDYILKKGVSIDYIKNLKIAELKAIYDLLGVYSDVRRFKKNGCC